MHWFDNRFGKDPVLPDLDSEEEQSASAASAPPPADKAP